MLILTYDKEEAFLRSKIPLKAFKKLKKKDREEIRIIDFAGNGYCTDTVIKTLASKIKKPLKNLSEVNLQGCVLLTDYGIKWLCKIITGAENLRNIYLDGCSKLTDSSLIMFDEVAPPFCRIFMRGTSLTRIDELQTKFLHSSGCTYIRSREDEIKTSKFGCLHIIPQNSLKHSFSKYLQTKSLSPVDGNSYVADFKMGKWELSLLEMPLESPLLDITLSNPVQVMIPVDTASSIEEMKKHVTDTVTRVVAKEKYSLEYNIFKDEDNIIKDSDFIDDYATVNCVVNEEKILHCSSKDEKAPAMFLSKSFLTKTYNYFEVTVVDVQNPSEGDQIKIRLLSGNQRADYLKKGIGKTDDDPSDEDDDNDESEDDADDSNADDEILPVKSALIPGTTIRIGITGKWSSEYLCTGNYYKNVNGEIKTSHRKEKITRLFPQIKVVGSADIRLTNLKEPPKKNETKDESKWITCLSGKNIKYDAAGNIRQGVQNELGRFVAMVPFSPHNNECSITIENIGNVGEVYVGLGKQNHIFHSYVGDDDSEEEKSHHDHSNGNDNVGLEDSVFYQCKKGRLLTGNNQIIKKIEDGCPSNKDVLHIVVDFNCAEKKKCQLYFYKNEYLVTTCFKAVANVEKTVSSCYLLIALKGKDSHIRINNFYSNSLKSLDSSRITPGLMDCVDAFDDGIICGTDRKGGGLFLSKNPLNSNMMSFEVRMLSYEKYIDDDDDDDDDDDGDDARDGLAIGLYSTDFEEDMLMYANNGKIGKDGNTDDCRVQSFKEGDIIGCGIEVIDTERTSGFTSDGAFQDSQILKIYFVKNGERVYDRQFHYQSDGLFPTLFLGKGARVKILNFYTECQKFQRINNVLQSERMNKEKCLWNGCEFVVVGFGEKGNEEKMEMLKQNIDFKTDLFKLKDISSHVKDLEQHVETLDLQGQENFTHLAEICDNLQCLSENQQRLHFIHIDLALDRDIKTITELVLNIQERHRKHNKTLYELSKQMVRKKQEFLQIVESERVVDTNFFTLSDRNMKTDLGHLLKHLQQTGSLVLVDNGSRRYVLDVEFVFKTLPSILQQEGHDMDTRLCSAMGKSSKYLTVSGIANTLLQTCRNKTLVLKILCEIFGLIKVPCFRTGPEDLAFILTTRSMLGQPPVPVDQFFKGSENKKKDTVQMRNTYSFPHVFPDSLLSSIFGKVIRYGRVVILADNCIVTHLGAAQTTIIQTCEQSDKPAIIVESTCFRPELKELSSKHTIEQNVTEYTWNIFSLYTDIIDDLLLRRGLVPMIKKDIPSDLINTSVGCFHKWGQIDDDDDQSICTLCNMCCNDGEDCAWNGIRRGFLWTCDCYNIIKGCENCGICQSCAKEFWDIKCRLRPMPMTFHSTDELLEDVTLNPATNNEVEFLYFNGTCSPLVLENKHRTEIEVFPEEKDSDDEDDSDGVDNDKIEELAEGSTVRLKIGFLEEFFEDTQSVCVNNSSENIQYYASICREVIISHETGFLCYERSEEGEIPVGQLIGPKPFSSSFKKFSFEIIKPGENKTIGIGITPKIFPPDNMAGWCKNSYGLHIDDGKIYRSSGTTSAFETGIFGKKGDIVECELHFKVEACTLYFRHNGKEVYNATLKDPPVDGFFPCVCMHSIGSVVRLLEKDPWTPEKNNVSKMIRPLAFDTKLYDSFHISPAQEIYVREEAGWFLFYNPGSSCVYFKIFQLNEDAESRFISIGLLFPKEHSPMHLYGITIGEGQPLAIIWTTCEYKEREKERRRVFDQLVDGKEDGNSIWKHTLNVKRLKDNNANLQNTTEVNPKEDQLYLQVFVNGILHKSYWIDSSKYKFKIENSEADFIVKYPKAPTYHYPEKIKKGMKVVIKETGEDAYATSVITEVNDNNSYKVRYINSCDEEETATLNEQGNGCVGLSLEDWKQSTEDKNWNNDLLYSEDLKKTQVYVAPYLLTEGSRLALLELDSSWKINVLKQFGNCSQVLTKVTVQEQQIVQLSKTLDNWKINDANRYFIFLPRKLDFHKLEFPDIVNTFKDFAIHPLCLDTYEDLEVCGHFIDVPGYKPQNELLPAIIFGSKEVGWNYIAMLRSKMQIPYYENIIGGEIEEFKRNQIEDRMTRLMNLYASYCALLSTECGDLFYQQELDSKTKDIIFKSLPQPVSMAESLGNNIQDSVWYLSERDITLCKDHMIADSENFFGFSMQSFSFDKYAGLLKEFIWMDSKIELEELPSDFFQRLTSVHSIEFKKCNLKQTSLPNGISNCKDLKELTLDNLPFSSLPSDLISAPRLRDVKIMNMPVKDLELKLPCTNTLTELRISLLLIESVPKEICELTFLQTLSIACNPITELPDEMEKLTNLEVLNMNGIPWVTLAESRSITKEEFMEWCTEKTNLTNYLSKMKVSDLFTEYDEKKSGVLTEKEVAALNLHLLFTIPRLGTQQFEHIDLFTSKPVNDGMTKGNEVVGGIPPVIFRMKNLKKLSLKYQGITKVPDEIKSLHNLEELDLDHCPLLEQISGEAGNLLNIRGISLLGCPSLNTPPQEVVKNGFSSVKAFLKELAAGHILCPRTKLMLVGLGGTGKTSLIHALMKNSKKQKDGNDDEKQNENQQEILLTDGIDIHDWTIRGENGEEKLTFHTWDFAGQTVYYHTHQFFLTNRAVYLLLWNMRSGYEHAGLDFWLNSIMCHAPDAPILIVGTHLDEVSIPQLPEKDMQSRYNIHGFYYVSSKDGTNIEQLERELVKVAIEQPYMKQTVPKVWIAFEERLKSYGNYYDFLKMEEVKSIANENGIPEEKMELAMQFLGDLGTIQYFNSDKLNEKIIIRPQWIVDVMAKIVSVKNTLITENKGRFRHKDMRIVWEDFETDRYDNKEVFDWLLGLTEEFDLTFRAPESEENERSEAFNIVPCLVPDDEPEQEILETFTKKRGSRIMQILYRFKYLPVGLFNRAQVRLFQYARDTNIWKRGSFLHKGDHTILIQQLKRTSDVSVVVQGPRPENTILNIHEVFESLKDETYHGVTYDLYIPCPECLPEEGIRNCCMFEDVLIGSAMDSKRNVHFLQCRKGFHEIPLVFLQAALPEATSNDFHLCLQQSINSLQEINSNMEKEVVVIYSQDDIPTVHETNKIDPKMITDDLKRSGISCCLGNVIDVGSELFMRSIIKMCKVVIVCVSENLAEDTRCCEALHYANSLGIPICSVVISENKQWKGDALGFLIGNPLMSMMRNRSRYDSHIQELEKMVTKKLDQQQKGNERKQCFISYCWKNSREAASKGTKTDKSSLGEDPRQIKKYLEGNGISCWIDEKEVGNVPYFRVRHMRRLRPVETEEVFIFFCALASFNWLTEYYSMTKYEDQLSKDIHKGICNCTVAILCVSTEYIQSIACMMEARFIIQNMKRPFIMAKVGKSEGWKMSELGLIMAQYETYEVVDFQSESNAFQRLLELTQKKIEQHKDVLSKFQIETFEVESDAQNEKSEPKNVDEEDGQSDGIDRSDLNLQETQIEQYEKSTLSEEVELIQRKFMRHCSKTASAKFQDMPRLLVFEFSQTETSFRQSKADTDKVKFTDHETVEELQAEKDKEQPKSHTEDSDWRKQHVCIRALCEHEEGWHLIKYSLPLKEKPEEVTKEKSRDKNFDEIEKVLKEKPREVKNEKPRGMNFGDIKKVLKDTASYLKYIYIVLQFSSISLECLNGKKGEEFQKWISQQAKEKSKMETSFSDGFDSLKTFVMKQEGGETFLEKLQKCHLPTGRNVWLCGEDDYNHQGGERITKLGMGTRGKGITTLYKEDMYLYEYLQKAIGSGIFEFESMHYEERWKHGTTEIKILRRSGANGSVNCSFTRTLNQQSQTVDLGKQEVEFKHGETEKLITVEIKKQEITQDAKLAMELTESEDVRLGETRRAVIFIRYDGDSGIFQFPKDTFISTLSTLKSKSKLAIPVKRTQGTDSDVLIRWKSVNKTEYVEDYEPTEGVLEFKAGVTDKHIAIFLKQDHTIPFEEETVVELHIMQHEKTHANIGKAKCTTVTVKNDLEQHIREKILKKIPEKPAVGEEFTDTDADARRPPKFKTVATAAEITTSLANRTKNSSVCCLQ